MPKLNTKARGMTSLEIAIIVAIVLVIAIAVGWYLYVTFASASQQTGLVVTEATIYKPQSGEPTILLKVVPQGSAQAQIIRIEVAGQTFTCNTVVNKPGYLQGSLKGLTVAIGQTLTGRVVLASGAVSPFTATVVAQDQNTQLPTADFNCASQ